eukprot:COSAG01_NODE_734_length_13974_cov_57.831784_1_plen_41_part_10
MVARATIVTILGTVPYIPCFARGAGHKGGGRRGGAGVHEQG